MIKSKLRSVALFGSILLLLAILATTIILIYKSFYVSMRFANNEPIVLVIDKDSSAKSFVSGLKTRQLINSDKLFLIYIRTLGLSKRLKAGTYELVYGESAKHLLQRIIAGDVLKKSFQIIEGTTQSQISEKLKRSTYLTYNDDDWFTSLSQQDNLFLLCDKEPLSNLVDERAESCVKVLKNNKKLASLEGLFLADTYQYDAGSDARVLLIQAHEKLKNYLFDSWNSRSTSLAYSNPYELLIVASILEKESASFEERRIISGVIVNRLARRMPLQMDPTVIYGLGKLYTGKLSHNDLKIDSKYNSYRYRGLPPTPITMVGRSSIDAASHPKDTNYLYFVAKGDGTHIFSETYKQQRQAIKRYLGKSHE
jgi:UPF0755 protein